MLGSCSGCLDLFGLSKGRLQTMYGVFEQGTRLFDAVLRQFFVSTFLWLRGLSCCRTLS
jgi:hypothetical protein